HQIGLARAVRERDDAEADEVVAPHRGGDELDRATGQPEIEDPQGVSPTPVEHEPDWFTEDSWQCRHTGYRTCPKGGPGRSRAGPPGRASHVDPVTAHRGTLRRVPAQRLALVSGHQPAVHGDHP